MKSLPMLPTHLLPLSRLTLPTVLTCALLTACGGAAETAAPVAPVAPVAPAPVVATLSGTVAVGAPITGGSLRVLDASGAVVVENVAIDADGRYAAITLTGAAPWRIEACGYTGPNYQCIYSVAQAAGTANVTPLTTAVMLLASGQTPEALMGGVATGLTASALGTAQTALLTSLAPVLADAGVATTLDFVTGSLSAGSRTGYDRVLDAVGVSTGTDTQPFVQIVPRLGTGNLYMEAGSAVVGSLAADSRAANLPLAGLETLFRGMTAAVRSATACADSSSGLASLLSSNATLSMDGPEPATGPAAVGAALCGFLAGQPSQAGGEPARWGSRFLSPTLGRCDFSGSTPVCAISFVLEAADGGIESVGGGMAVSYENAVWRFKGDRHPVAIHAEAKVQRDRRIDGSTPVDTYSRALSIDIAALSGLACAQVTQRNAEGAAVTLAYYKPHAGGSDLRSLSAWRDGMGGENRSLNPATGLTRSADDSWLMLPQGASGDAAVRNFFRGGRTLTVSLYSNSACTTPMSVAGRSSYEVDVDGVPPVWDAMAGLPWPELSDSAKTGLRTFALAAGASADYSASWGFARGAVAVNGITFCGDRATCGDGDTGRLGTAAVMGARRTASVVVRAGTAALAEGAYRMLALDGRTGDGVGMQSNFTSCATVPSGQMCQ